MLSDPSPTHTMLPDKDGPAVVGSVNSSVVGEDPSVSLFRHYLRLKTVHPEPDYGETRAFNVQYQTLSLYFE